VGAASPGRWSAIANYVEHPVLRFLRRITAGEDTAGSDAQLLAAFSRRRDEAAFTQLVRRHSPMVFGVCTRVLGNTADAEDAFQATFLVLTRKAASLRQPATLANWLYGVAYRTAQRARRDTARRRLRERQVATMGQAETADESARRELRQVLDDELHRLPQRYRAAVVLCYLEGRTQEEAARQLGCPRATIATRLARACARLRAPLARRGFALSAAAVASLLAAEEATAAPTALVDATIGVAMRLPAGEATAATAASARALTLTKEVLSAMFVTKLKTLAVLLLAAAALGAAVLGLTRAAPAGDEPGPAARTPARTGEGPQEDRALKEFAGDWQVVRLQEGNRVASEDDMKGMHWKITGSRIEAFDPGQKVAGPCTFRINPRKDPRHIDLTASEGLHKGHTIEGIYRLAGPWLVICLRNDQHPEKGRPTEFRADDGTDQAMIALAKAPEPARPNPLKGTWEVTEYINNRERVPATVLRGEMFKDGRVELGTWAMSHVNPRSGIHKSQPYRIDGGKDRGRIEFLWGAQVARGIYRFDGDTLRLCIADPDAEPPKDFPEGEGLFGGRLLHLELLTLKKMKVP
jgi:RNA polymerase sigma factor (sigma-70 family)